MFIGITGQIGSGKTTAAKILASFGAVVIDADQIGRRVVDRSAPLRKRLASLFGGEILTPSGKLSRKKLARLAFADKAAKQRLDRLVHPFLFKEMRRQMRELSKRHDVVVIDAALLLDWELDRRMDVVLVIHASEETRLKRLSARGISKEDALARQKAQMPFSEYRNRGDRIILNNGTIEQLRSRLHRIWEECIVRNIDRFS
jgi:dephospho-CoA kinase